MLNTPDWVRENPHKRIYHKTLYIIQIYLGSNIHSSFTTCVKLDTSSDEPVPRCFESRQVQSCTDLEPERSQTDVLPHPHNPARRASNGLAPNGNATSGPPHCNRTPQQARCHRSTEILILRESEEASNATSPGPVLQSRIRALTLKIQIILFTTETHLHIDLEFYFHTLFIQTDSQYFTVTRSVIYLFSFLTSGCRHPELEKQTCQIQNEAGLTCSSGTQQLRKHTGPEAERRRPQRSLVPQDPAAACLGPPEERGQRSEF